MKLTGIFILALLSFAVIGQATRTVIADEGNRTGSSDDDYNESSDVKRTGTGMSSVSIDKEQSYQLQDGETLVGTWEEDAGNLPDEVITEDVAVQNPDGTISQVTKTRTIKVKKSKLFKRVRSMKKYSVNIGTIRGILPFLAEQEHIELTSEDMQLLNAIVATDGNRFASQYSYTQVLLADLRLTLNSILTGFKAPLSADDVDQIEYQIRTCEGPGFYRVLDTSSKETHTSKLWTVMAEVIVATCAKEKPGVQLFAFSSSKTGTFKPGYYSDENDKTVDGLVTRWLFKQAWLLFNCPDSPTKYSTVTPTLGADGRVVSMTYHDEDGKEHVSQLNQ